MGLFGNLERDRAHAPHRSEDDDAIVGANWRPLGERQPAGDSRDPARGGDRIVDTVRNRNGELPGELGALGEESVATDSPTFSKEVHTLAIETSDRLAARYIRERRVR